jgi:hypothetical protein
VVEGAQPALVLVDRGAPTWMPLGVTAPAEAALPSAPPPPSPATQPGKKQPHPRVADPADWRGKLHATRQAAAPAARATAAAVAVAPVEDPAEAAPHWRDELCDWAEKQLAAPRRPVEPPALPEDSTLATVSSRLALDDKAARALALVYAARLLGHADLPAATVARVLQGDEAAWNEALGHGLGGRLGLLRARDGRVALSAPTGRFLDGTPPLIPILPGGVSDAELPGGNVQLDGGVERLTDIGARLAERYGYDVALVLVDGDKPVRTLASKLVEARLHGAWPIVDISVKARPWTAGLDDGPSVIIVRGDEVPADIKALPPL